MLLIGLVQTSSIGYDVESHRDGGYHYHMAVKLSKARRWLRVKHILKDEYNMIIHFSSNHVNYFTAWEYVTKEDNNALHSPQHPDLNNNIPISTAASTKRAESRSGESTDAPRKRRRRLSAFDVSEIVIKHNIKTRTQLLALAEQKKRA